MLKNPGTDESVHSSDLYLTDSTSAVRDRSVCPRVFQHPAIFRIGIFILTFLLNPTVSLNLTAATKAIQLGRLWDGHRVIANSVVIVENDKVQSVTASGKIPAGAEVIDLR